MERKTKIRFALSAMGATAGFILVGWAGGCVSTRLPPRISTQQGSVIAQTRFPVTVGVETFGSPAYSESLLKALRQSGLFDRVERLEDLSQPPDLVARVERRIYGTAVMPCATALTLGIVPTTVNEEWGESFSFSRPHKPGEKIGVEFSYTAPTTLGWLALFKSVSPEVVLGDVEAHPRYREGLAAKIAERAGEINTLLRDSAPPN